MRPTVPKYGTHVFRSELCPRRNQPESPLGVRPLQDSGTDAHREVSGPTGLGVGNQDPHQAPRHPVGKWMMGSTGLVTSPVDPEFSPKNGILEQPNFGCFKIRF